ncbi:hypothetical protein [Candidatus Contubernalis alkaliaceticus]|uniref:hypothetical protein n=1 Tax=Candidatus Contubernalis alkaliaceticus TaxID=338645 RepID=UPI001F4C26E9|nr:hypothetical protein [Candidatus Contubernalis alkalaceticus]UNC92328.1 DUF4878 domain-containing protein [Candidatus Contubernalis alkalaceticus]
MKKLSLITITLILICCLAFSGCGGKGGSEKASNPEDVVRSYWEAFAKTDFETAADYVISDHQDEIRNLKDEMKDELFGEEMLSVMFGRFKIKTTGHEIDGSNATVEGILTYPNMDHFFENFFTVMFEIMMFEDEDLTDEDYEILLDSFQEIMAETPDLEENITVELIMENGQWKIIDMPDFDIDL